MPFINLSFDEASNILTDRAVIIKLLKERKINPREADLLELIHRFGKEQNDELEKKIIDICTIYFGEGGLEASSTLIRFVKSNTKRVAWVLFSRSFQSITYDNRDPLEDYVPRVSEVLTIQSRYRVSR
ncbi:MAG: hypothetical protein EAX86_02195 [Candidatus Heimdallarchaeota archaeon]|nr:hypothetical protein [Candidatus Heimdallarchaeota archaeon]